MPSDPNVTLTHVGLDLNASRVRAVAGSDGQHRAARTIGEMLMAWLGPFSGRRGRGGAGANALGRHGADCRSGWSGAHLVRRYGEREHRSPPAVGDTSQLIAQRLA